MDAFFSGVLAGYGIAIPVGAIALLIIQVGIKCGFRCAFMAGAGAATADLIYAGLAVVGGAALAQVIDSAGDAFRIASGIVLIAIAVPALLFVLAGLDVMTLQTAYAASIASSLITLFVVGLYEGRNASMGWTHSVLSGVAAGSIGLIVIALEAFFE